ncbi:hypothetical protein [Sphingomonas baiyangensis]
MDTQVVDVRCVAVLERGDKFALAAVPRAETGELLFPGDDRLMVAVDDPASAEQLKQEVMAHEEHVDRAVRAHCGHVAHRGREEPGKLSAV